MAGVLLLIFYIILGILAGAALFISEESWIKKVWLGGVLGMMLFMWSHVPFSFFLGFTVKSHLLGLVLSLLAVAGVFYGKAFYTVRRGNAEGEIAASYKDALTLPFRKFFRKYTKRTLLKDLFILALVGVFTVLAVSLIQSHTLNYDQGAYYTGQCTYGDMNMHLGFITSIARQHTFPPVYSLMGGAEALNYPFLCDTVSSSLLLFGTALREAYMIPMFAAFLLVFLGVWFVAEGILGKAGRTAIAFLIFLLDGGLGIIYFLDGTKTDPDNFTRIFTQFYETPTNLVDNNVRWTNVIVDMLLPQRATLFGWMCLFAVLFIFHKGVFGRKTSYMLLAGVLAGFLPMIHTHSYFAVGLIAIAWIIATLIRDRFNRATMLRWLLFGIPALVISVPQLMIWTFNAVGGDSFIRFVFNWSNSQAGDNWLWFWVKNVGVAFLLIPPAFFAASREKKLVYTGAFFIFLTAEFIVFQPNLYDNIKLFFVWYLYMAIMIADFIGVCYEKIRTVPGVKTAIALLVFVMTVSGVLTIQREIKSGERDKSKHSGPAYQLYNSANVSAAEWIEDNTDPKSVFLCWNNHNNAIASLTGRNIYVGAGTFLYFHGVNYQPREQLMKQMFTDEAVFEEKRVEANIDYVYVGDYERGSFGDRLITDYLRENYECVYSDKGIEIFKVGGVPAPGST